MKLILIVFFTIIFSSNNLFANFKGNIIVKVENEIITNFEIKNKILINILSKQNKSTEYKQIKKQALETLIQQNQKEIELKISDKK